MPNRLADETSPYLLQHAHNPVDWYPWGAEAFERARSENRPILLSVGYSACHWCHVMERESFEDDATAALMNQLFVNVKVDREERPDVDAIYMQAVQAMTGHGGWPMTVFLTPDLHPFWGGTYFPPQDRHGMPSFRRVLAAVSDAYRSRPDDIQRVAASMREMYAAASDRARSSGTLTPDLLLRAARALLVQYDREHGGFGGAPKFPQPMAMEFLLQQWARQGNEAALDAARHSFLRMARGGIHDQLGGGFARYAVDERWLVPHFEKPSTDNALLARLGVHLWQVTQDIEIREVTERTLDFVLREMTSEEGGFYSMLDADSEGVEGRFYVFRYDEVVSALLPFGNEQRLFVLDYWGVTPEGNFEGQNILHVRRPLREVAGRHSMPEAEAEDLVNRARKILFDVRSRRVRPAADDKIIASWNGLMIRAFVEAAGAFQRVDYRQAAIRAAEMLFGTMVVDNRVRRSRRAGIISQVGFLEDHASVALAALALFGLTLDRLWFERARALTRSALLHYWDEDAGTFFDTDTSIADLPTRPRDTTDNAVPSGTSLAADLLTRMAVLTGDEKLHRVANTVLETLAEPMARYPLAFGHLLQAADMSVYGAVELTLPGEASRPDLLSLAASAGAIFVPSLVIAGGEPDEGRDIVLLADRSMSEGRATAYVCRRYSCTPPITDPARLASALIESARLRNT